MVLRLNSDSYEFKVFHERELVQVLHNLSLLEDVRNGKLKCAICNKTITLDNFGAIFRKEGKIYVVCEDARCIGGVENIGRN